ncbi:MAG: LolA-like putative outer membrane lipoprotein chaperone [Phocaeicola sp.]
MKKVFYLFLLLLLPPSLWAQKETRARELLDRTWSGLENKEGVLISFGGTAQGVMQLQGNKFHLESEGIESWFDGHTQWSYLAGSDEVNISTPTPDELKQIHPLYLLSSYKEGYNYQYLGERTTQGVKGHTIFLTPETKEDIQSITVVIDAQYNPLFLAVETTNQPKTEIRIKNIQKGQAFKNGNFQFDKRKFPTAEIIDLR